MTNRPAFGRAHLHARCRRVEDALSRRSALSKSAMRYVLSGRFGKLAALLERAEHVARGKSSVRNWYRRVSAEVGEPCVVRV